MPHIEKITQDFTEISTGETILNIDAFCAELDSLDPQHRQRMISHDIKAYMGNITTLASIINFSNPPPLYVIHEEDQFILSAIPYIRELYDHVYSPELFSRIKSTWPDAIFREVTDMGEMIPLLLNSSICLIRPTRDRLEALSNTFVSIQSLARSTDCATNILPSEPIFIDGIRSTVALQYMRNAKIHKKEDTTHMAYLEFLQNPRLIIENVYLGIPENFLEDGVSGNHGSGVGLTLSRAFAAAADIKTQLSPVIKNGDTTIQAWIDI